MTIAEEIIILATKQKIKNKKELENLKRLVAEKTKSPLVNQVQLLEAYHKLAEKKRIKPNALLEKILITRPMRSLSGIVNITVLTKPYGCPGKCIFCPWETDFPKSYLRGEPAADRAYELKFNPYQQVQKRLEMLTQQGHPIDKVELRIVGGSWSFYPKNYQMQFIKDCFRAANDFGLKRKLKSNVSLKKIFQINEEARARIIGLSIETRPDLINEEEIKRLRQLGATMVELGAQTVFDEIHQLNRTGLNTAIIEKATQLLKDAGFKVLYHLMPNLYGSDFKKDEQMFKIVFNDERFKPDWLKIYPAVVLENTELYKLWQEGKYEPYNDGILKKLLISVKKQTPYWVRIARVIRDIPAQKIVAGTKLSNLREIIQSEMRKNNERCFCIRCREVKGDYDPKEKIYLFKEEYDASYGKEMFLSFENKNRTKLFSFLRLRYPSSLTNPIFKSLNGAALIREIKTYGELVPLSVKKLAPQHRGLGKRLMKEAERIVKKEFKLNKLAVIAGVGVRGYFRKLGYQLKDTYMVKNL